MAKKFLNNGEYGDLAKYHEEFDKTIFGKSIKIYISVLTSLAIIGLAMGGLFMIMNALGENNCDIIAAMCALLFFVNVSLTIVAQIIYEHMVMNYIGFKKE
jgi:hypothetical protein